MNHTIRRIAPSVFSVSAAAITALAATSSSFTECQQEKKKRPKLIFLGSGSSTGCPKPLCAMLFQKHEARTLLQKEFEDKCRVSNVAILGDPRHNIDYRNNPSLLISHYEQGEAKNIVIDVGKTFRETALRWMPAHEIQSLDAIVLTHHHMDAVGGLDDVRGFQRFRGLNKTEPPDRISLPVFMSQECLDQVSSQFPWLFPKQTKASQPVDKDKPIVKRDVAALDVHVINVFEPFDAAGLELMPLPVWHGDDLISLGFSFSLQNSHGKRTNVLYISDISRMPPETMDYIQHKLPPTDLLIVDTLLPKFQHPVHFSLEQAVAFSKEIGAKQTYLIGMSCDAFPPHEEMNAKLAEEHGGSIQFARDGLVLIF